MHLPISGQLLVQVRSMSPSSAASLSNAQPRLYTSQQLRPAIRQALWESGGNWCVQPRRTHQFAGRVKCPCRGPVERSDLCIRKACEIRLERNETSELNRKLGKEHLNALEYVGSKRESVLLAACVICRYRSSSEHAFVLGYTLSGRRRVTTSHLREQFPHSTCISF